jgi:protein TonB
MDIALSVSGVLVGIAALALIILSSIVVLRIVFGTKENLASRDRNKSAEPSSRTKYPEVNVFRLNGSLLRFGLAAALAFSMIAFNWTTYDGVFVPENYGAMDESFDQIEPPITHVTPPEIKPPPAEPIIEEVPEDEIPDEQPEYEPPSIEDDFSFEEVPVSEPKKKFTPVPPPPLPEGPDDDIDEIEKFVEEMPRFPGCESTGGSIEDRKACSDKKLLEYLYKNLKYPVIARENGVQGRVYIQFVVEKDGSISGAKIVRDAEAGLGQSALKVVEEMNNLPAKWTPGKKQGSVVRVLYTLPVTFTLQN